MQPTLGISSLGAPAPASTTPKSTMEKDDFLKLLVEQLRSQNPMSASSNDPSQFVAQMSQFALVEQVTNLTKANEQLLKTARMDEAVGLVGRTVTYTDGDATASGVVERVGVVDGKPVLTVGGRAGVDPALLVEVR
jgi:flagellar basal-body rod modification protein FlgD